MSEIKNRIDFVYIFDVQDGNPNGDPDAGNLPRVDAETGMGLVTDVCLKRKVRNYVQIAKGCTNGYDIFIKEKAILNKSIDAAHEEDSVKNAKDKTSAARVVMCQKFYDIRTFGAVMSTDKMQDKYVDLYSLLSHALLTPLLQWSIPSPVWLLLQKKNQRNKVVIIVLWVAKPQYLMVSTFATDSFQLTLHNKPVSRKKIYHCSGMH